MGLYWDIMGYAVYLNWITKQVGYSWMDMFSCFSFFFLWGEANLGVVKPMIRKRSNFKRMVQSCPICLAIFRTHTHTLFYIESVLYSVL